MVKVDIKNQTRQTDGGSIIFQVRWQLQLMGVRAELVMHALARPAVRHQQRSESYSGAGTHSSSCSALGRSGKQGFEIRRKSGIN
jgi:hypothetical protein